MRDAISRQSAPAKTTLLLAATLLLWGCAGTPEKTPESTTSAPAQVEQTSEPTQLSLTLPPSQFETQFNRAEHSLARFDWMQASTVLDAVGELGEESDDDLYRNYLLARIAFIRGQPQSALQQLEALENRATNQALRYRILSFRHHILELQGSAIDSAFTADQILRMTPPDGNAWKRTTWRNLQRTTPQELQAALPAATDPQWLAWLELIRISRENTRALSAALQQWRAQNPGHPAAKPLPGGQDYLLQTPPADASIALLLPLSSRLAPAGKAVLDGYLAAYYAAQGNGPPASQLMVLDTDTYGSARAAYDDAVSRGATLVVGPLDKDGVADLATRLERAIPVLALNRVDQVLPAASGSALVQLSLAPEDEAHRIAELAFGQGARAALVISPAGEWGSKVESALRQRWSALGGAVVASIEYSDQSEYSADLKETLGLLASEQRGRNIRDMLATNIEVTPRRRMDPDVVFLLSRNGAEARSIKPLLAFHYAGTLPVYATSSIYNGVPDERNRDLNGINVVETPWLLGASPELRVAIAAGGTGRGVYTRLNALGADAFRLQADFRRLQAGADALLAGNTGLLSMDPELRIHRELTLATFDEGSLQRQ